MESIESSGEAEVSVQTTKIEISKEHREGKQTIYELVILTLPNVMLIDQIIISEINIRKKMKKTTDNPPTAALNWKG